MDMSAYIAGRAARLAAAPFMRFVADRAVDPRRRLAFAPCIAPWVMSFADLSKFVLPAPVIDPLQAYVNAHAHEEEDHWRLYVADLEALALAGPASLPDAVAFLWRDDLWAVRRAGRGLLDLAAGARTSTMRLLLLEAIEATSAVGFASARQAARDFTAQTGVTLRYFGEEHQGLEDAHGLATEHHDVQASLVIPESLLPDARCAVDALFDLVEGMCDALPTQLAA